MRLPEAVRLPEHTRVYVVVPGIEAMGQLHVRSPRLARPEQAAHFVKEVVEEEYNAIL